MTAAPRPKVAGLCPDCGDVPGDGCRCAELLAEAATAPAYGRVRLADVQAAMTALATTTGGISQ